MSSYKILCRGEDIRRRNENSFEVIQQPARQLDIVGRFLESE